MKSPIPPTGGQGGHYGGGAPGDIRVFDTNPEPSSPTRVPHRFRGVRLRRRKRSEMVRPPRVGWGLVAIVSGAGAIALGLMHVGEAIALMRETLERPLARVEPENVDYARMALAEAWMESGGCASSGWSRWVSARSFSCET